MNPDIPSWREIREGIPPVFKYRRELKPPRPPGNHNGASSPFRFLYPIIYSPETRRIIDEGSYIHDWLYMYGRLPGFATSDMTRNQSDGIYRQFFFDHNRRRIGRLHYYIVDRLGWIAWRHNADFMIRMGDVDSESYLERKAREQAAQEPAG